MKTPSIAREIKREAEVIQWSDAFFNWRLDFHPHVNLIEAAEMFLKLHSHCPKRFDAEWFCLNYAARV